MGDDVLLIYDHPASFKTVDLSVWSNMIKVYGFTVNPSKNY